MRCLDCPYDTSPVAQSNGRFTAEIGIVGMAPGAEEIKSGVPFVGPSGDLLRSTLDLVGIGQNVFMTNAVACKPPDDEPSNDAIKACSARLRSELTRSPRRLVIALGNAAVRAVTGLHQLKITRVRGTVFESDYGPVLAAFHPAAILRSPTTYRLFEQDLRYAYEVLHNGKRSPEDVSWIVCDDAERIDLLNQRLRKSAICALDIETTERNPRRDRILCVGISWQPGKAAIVPWELLSLVDWSATKWIYHNGKFDTEFMHNAGYDLSFDEDTMLQHYSMCEIKGTHSLGQLASDYLGAEEYKNKIRQVEDRSTFSYEFVPRAEMHEYLAKDVSYTYSLNSIFKSQLATDANAKKLYYSLLMPASKMLQRVERNGIPIDLDALDALAVELQAEMMRHKENMRAMLRADFGERKIKVRGLKGTFTADTFNPGSPKQVAGILYGHYKLKPVKPNRKFKWQTSAPMIETLPKHPFTDGLIGFRTAAKFLGTYCKGIKKQVWIDGRWYVSFLLPGTETGRPSTRPNSQNMPRPERDKETGEYTRANIRKIVAAPKNKRLVECDYSQCEMRTLAYYSRDPFLCDVFDRGLDIHTEVASRIFGLGHSPEERQTAKTINFSILYGAGYEVLVARNKIAEQKAKDAIQAWQDMAPKAFAFLEWCKRQPLIGKPLYTPFGRKREWGLISKQNQHSVMNEASNFPIQSLASDFLLLAAIEVIDKLESLGVKIVNLIHDSILMEVLDDENLIGEVIEYVTTTMERMPSKYLSDCEIPFVSDAKTGYNFGELRKWEGVSCEKSA